jgi:hypothetical protein
VRPGGIAEPLADLAHAQGGVQQQQLGAAQLQGRAVVLGRHAVDLPEHGVAVVGRVAQAAHGGLQGRLLAQLNLALDQVRQPLGGLNGALRHDGGFPRVARQGHRRGGVHQGREQVAQAGADLQPP